MARASLTIEKRDASGKSPTARRTRKEGRVPGVMYHSDGNIAFSADALELAAVLRKGATLVDATVDGTEHLTVVKEYQVHPVRGSLVHIDLQAVRMDQSVRTTASLTLTGVAPGIKEGGIVTQGAREVLIECLASAIPDTIEYDISHVHAGETFILRDVPAPDGVRFLDDEGTMVISIAVPRGAKKKKDAEGNDVDMTVDEEEAANAAEAAGNA